MAVKQQHSHFRDYIYLVDTIKTTVVIVVVIVVIVRLFSPTTNVIAVLYRMHMLRLYKGDKSFMPSDLDTDPAEVLVGYFPI